MGSIDEIKERLDIVDLVSDYVSLKKSGRNFKALCPFHSEKTPSFFVFPERGTWHCFGSCGTGGDIFSFIMKKEGVEFGEALRMLAERAGVTLASRQREEDANRQAERLYGVNEAAAQYYHNLLLNDGSAEPARRHIEQRGLSRETVDSFELGFSPDGRDELIRHLEERGYKREELVEAGLAVAKEGEGLRDMFRNRLIIPIRNDKGRVVGFGARTLGDTQPKYLNSPQTAVFDKSGLLYGLDRARGAIRQQDMAIIMEGYMDVLTAHQHGITNAVAPMGTSLTEKQVGVLKRLTKKMALALDADAAGQQATLRGLEVARNALSQRVDSRDRGWLEGDSRLQGSLKVIIMPQGKDPDEVIRQSTEEWQRMVEEATSVMDYFFQAAVAKLDLDSAEGKSAAAERLLPVIMGMAGEVERDLYLKRLSKMVGVDEKTLIDRAARLRPTVREKAKRSVALPDSPIATHPLEEYCLALLLQHPELRPSGAALPPEYFEGTENRQLFLHWLEAPDASVDSIRQGLDRSLHEHVDKLAGRELPPASARELETALADCARRLREQQLRKLKSMEEMLISEAESSGDKNIIKEQVETLLQKALEPTSQLKDLFEKARRERKGAGQ